MAARALGQNKKTHCQCGGGFEFGNSSQLPTATQAISAYAGSSRLVFMNCILDCAGLFVNQHGAFFLTPPGSGIFILNKVDICSNEFRVFG